MKKICVMFLLIVIGIIITSTIALCAESNNLIDIVFNPSETGDKAGEAVLNKMQSGINLLIQKVFPLIGIALLGYSIVKLMTGSDEGKRSVLWVVLGLGALACITSIVGSIFGLFK